MLQELRGKGGFSREAIETKKEKIKEYIVYSIKAGTLDAH